MLFLKTLLITISPYRAQLKNWKNYLNLIGEKKDEERMRILFERCLIACAFYEGFWLKVRTEW